MDFKLARVRYSQLKENSKLMVVTNTVLVSLLTVSLFVNFQKDTVVINNLNESCQESMVAASSMNEANHRRLGLYLAGMLGNITPESAGKIDNNILPFASPDIYQRVNDLIALQTASLIEEKVAMSFFAESAFVEDGTTFVSGKGAMRGLTDKTVKFVRTYEFVFDVHNYTPTFSYMDVYDDVPRDSVWQAKNKKVSK